MEPGYAIYAKIADINEPVKTAEGIYTTGPVGWVE